MKKTWEQRKLYVDWPKNISINFRLNTDVRLLFCFVYLGPQWPRITEEWVRLRRKLLHFFCFGSVTWEICEPVAEEWHDRKKVVLSISELPAIWEERKYNLRVSFANTYDFQAFCRLIPSWCNYRILCCHLDWGQLSVFIYEHVVFVLVVVFFEGVSKYPFGLQVEGGCSNAISPGSVFCFEDKCLPWACFKTWELFCACAFVPIQCVTS